MPNQYKSIALIIHDICVMLYGHEVILIRNLIAINIFPASWICQASLYSTSPLTSQLTTSTYKRKGMEGFELDLIVHPRN
jgi:hypothetical protein